MTSDSRVRDRTMALAGVCQAARIVDLAAKTGRWPEPFVEASIHSLFCFEPDSIQAVFGTLQGVRLGLEQLARCLELSHDHDAAHTLKYTLAILQLERCFAKRADLQSVVHSRLKHAAYNAENFAPETSSLCAHIASIYQDTLSSLPYRIRVTGSTQHLNNETVSDLVRTLLMAGVRSAFLWRQMGGSRFKLVCSRTVTRKIASQIANELGI